VPAGALLSRLPIRLRLTLAFTAVMAVVLGATGVFVYYHLEHGLDGSIDAGLHARADDLAAVVEQVREPGVPPARLQLGRDGGDVQVLDLGGRVLGGSPGNQARPLLEPAELRRARTRAVLVSRGERQRLLARPAGGARDRVVIVVGDSLEQREHAMETLAGALLVGGPLALLLAAGAGYGLAAGALLPVEGMRRRARTISADRPSARLPLPPADDEVRRLGETLNDMLGRLEAGLRRERAFVADAGHELRTPLAILKMELELAMRDGATVEDLQAALRSAAEETDRLAQLADDLLVLARADDGKLPVRLAPVAAQALLDTIAGRFSVRAAALGRELAVEPCGELVVEGDELRLEQALGNLVDNALRYGDGTVRLHAAASSGTVELHVEDEGSGFDEALLPRAFERFTRADAARSRGGTGLGLAIVEEIALAHGGRAAAANTATGADVWLTLPVAGVPEARTGTTRTRSSPDQGPAPRSRA
jgi:heavy metal sensor kinase